MRPAKDERSVEFTIVEGSATEDQTPTILLAVCGARSANRVCTTRVKLKRQQSDTDWGRSHSASCPTPRTRTPVPAVRSKRHGSLSKAIVLKDEMRAATPSPIPNELISRDFEWVLKPPMFGLMTWGDIFNARQQVDLATLASLVHDVVDVIGTFHEAGYAAAVQAYLALAVDRHADYNSMCQSWDTSRESIGIPLAVKRLLCLGTIANRIRSVEVVATIVGSLSGSHG